MEYAFKSITRDRYIGQASKFAKITLCWYFLQYNAVYVVGNTDVPGYFGQTSHPFGPSNGFVDSSQIQIVHFDHKITLSGDN